MIYPNNTGCPLCQCVSKIMKRALLIIAFFFSLVASKGHDVLWWENLLSPRGGPQPPMIIEVYPDDLLFDDPPFETIKIFPDSQLIPFFGFFTEPCTVFVNMDPPKHPLIGVDVAPNPALEVDVDVYLKDVPP